ncbi:hypothetical protein MLPF_2508 [Mycobacterium lepromatosis]|nr:hypothetical protein MLPF_2508 [Mycobacterium lepromatosis]
MVLPHDIVENRAERDKLGRTHQLGHYRSWLLISNPTSTGTPDVNMMDSCTRQMDIVL